MAYLPNQAKVAGFTIIEVMIVLSIAGLIMLITFEAIPALMRNSRNNQRRQDVAIILQAVSHYELTDSGTFPQTCGFTPGPSSDCSASANPSFPNDYFLRFSANNLTYYRPAVPEVTLQSLSAGWAGSLHATTDTAGVYNYAKCNPNLSGYADSVGAGYNDVVALFEVETGNGWSPQCEQL